MAPGDVGVTLAYRLGLGWLVGRRRLILTTGGPSGEGLERVILPFTWERGVLHVPATGSEPWVAAIRRRPVAMAQAAPGPLAVAVVETAGGFALVPSGQPSPPPVFPDLNWVWAVAVVAAVVSLTSRRRRR